MANAIEEVVHKRPEPAEQHDAADKTVGEMVKSFISAGAQRNRHQPPGRQRRADRETKACRAVRDGKHRGDLRAVNLQMRRERALLCCHIVSAKKSNDPEGRYIIARTNVQSRPECTA